MQGSMSTIECPPPALTPAKDQRVAKRPHAAWKPLHWQEAAMESFGLGLFMIAACGFSALWESPRSPLAGQFNSNFTRRLAMALSMGATAIALIYSPWGRRSGAQLNPSTTVTFWRLGKVPTRDAAAYVGSQFLGGIAGVYAAAWIWGSAVTDPPVRYAVTVPGPVGRLAALTTEFAISFLMMTVVLGISNHQRWKSWTGVCAGCVVALNILLAGPISGMSMNPARTFASAFPAAEWTAFWVYVVAPVAGMLLAAELRLRLVGSGSVRCAKLHHPDHIRCIFCNSEGSR